MESYKNNLKKRCDEGAERICNLDEQSCLKVTVASMLSGIVASTITLFAIGKVVNNIMKGVDRNE